MNKKILLIDNFDSFTYNLAYMVKQNKAVKKVDVFRNDQIKLEEIDYYDKILLSPGPGLPKEANLLKPIIKAYSHKKDILGICLGLQAIGEVFGGYLTPAKNIYHGMSSLIHILKEKELLFKNIPHEIQAGRYHSWVLSRENFPSNELEITAFDAHYEIMAISHKTYKVKGLQFHPESILTPYGGEILKNWIHS